MMPYSTDVTPIKDINRFFKINPDGSRTFTGKSLELRVPTKFKKHGSLVVSDTVFTLAIFDMIFDETYQAGFNLLGTIQTDPSDIGSFSYKGIDYTTLHYREGDTFMRSSRILQDSHLVYVVWDEFVTSGGLPYWFDYQAALGIFQHARYLTGSGIGVSRSVFEGIISHLARDNRNIQKRYRLTKMERPMQFLALKSISQATDNTSSKLTGSYFKDEGITSALRYEVDQVQPFENILRGIASHSLVTKPHEPS